MEKDRYSLTVPATVNRVFQSFPNKEALYDGYRRMTYKELVQEAEYLAAGLEHLGIKKGDRIAVCLPNWHEFIVVFLAIVRIGAIIVPFNTRYRDDEVHHILQNSGAKIVFCTNKCGNVNHLELFKKAKGQIPSLEKVVSVRYTTNEFLSYEQLLNDGQASSVLDVNIDPIKDTCVILYTSGTTGLPKGAMLTHQNILYSAAVTADDLRCTYDDVVLVPVPLFHVFGLVISAYLSLLSGARMVLMEEYKAEDALRLIEQEKVTIHHGVPTMFILELNHSNFTAYDISSLRTGIIAAAPCPVEIVRRIRSEMNCNIMVSYGMSESSATITVTKWDDDDTVRSETVGKVVSETELIIVDENRRPLSVGEVGELACRGLGVMTAYFNAPDQTKKSMDDEGWFYTGDIAKIDENGNVRIVGRKKDVIIRGGYNIYPREVEEFLYTHPAVLEVAIVGLPDTVLGEVACVAVRLKEGTSVSVEELRLYMKGKIADFKVPDKIVFVDQFPMTASGKIQKMTLQRELRDKLSAELR